MSSESTFYTDGTNSNSFTTQASAVNTVNDAAWRNGKFGDTGSTWSATSGSSGSYLLNTGSVGSKSGSYYAWEIYTTYLRFDTSALDDDEEITGAHLSLYTTAITNTAGMTSNQTIEVYAGLTGGSDRPTFSSLPSTSADFNWYCEGNNGCTDISSPFTCPVNDGARDVGTILSNDLSIGSRTTHQLADNGSLDDWVNRTGYTYITLIHDIWGGGLAADGTNYPCNNGVYTLLGTDYYLNPAPYTPSSASGNAYGCTFAGRNSGNGPTLIINQGKTRYQMII
jgi:hypothetical protein